MIKADHQPWRRGACHIDRDAQAFYEEKVGQGVTHARATTQVDIILHLSISTANAAIDRMIEAAKQ